MLTTKNGFPGSVALSPRAYKLKTRITADYTWLGAAFNPTQFYKFYLAGKRDFSGCDLLNALVQGVGLGGGWGGGGVQLRQSPGSPPSRPKVVFGEGVARSGF